MTANTGQPPASAEAGDEVTAPPSAAHGAALGAALDAVPVIAIIRLRSADRAEEAVAAVAAGGVRAVEITWTTDGALDAVRRFHDQAATARARTVLGVGSVRRPAEAAAAVQAGAQFLVTPSFHPGVLDVAAEAGVPVVCGALTPTELDAATEAGAAYLKLFPASSAGPGYLREVLAPMPELRVIPTGGVLAVDVGKWAAAGAHAVAAGSALVHPDLVAAGDWAAITTRAGAYVAAWAHHRRPGPL